MQYNDMRSLLLATVLTSLAVLGACASATTQDSAAASGTVCTREKPVGSNFPVTTCRTAEQIAAEKAEADRVQRGVQQNATNRPAGQ